MDGVTMMDLFLSRFLFSSLFVSFLSFAIIMYILVRKVQLNYQQLNTSFFSNMYVRKAVWNGNGDNKKSASRQTTDYVDCLVGHIDVFLWREFTAGEVKQRRGHE